MEKETDRLRAKVIDFQHPLFENLIAWISPGEEGKADIEGSGNQ